MKLTQLNRFTGLLAAAAIGFIVAPPSSTAQDGPESVVSTPIKALEEKNPKLLWEMLPASYQSDINELVQEFAKNMDAQLWTAGVEFLAETGKLLEAQKGLLAKMGAESDPTMNAKEAEQGMEMFAKAIKKLVDSDLGSLNKMKSIDLGKVTDTLGKDILNLAEETAKLTGDADPFKLEAMKQVKLEVVSQDGDNATVKISGLPEVDLSGLQGGGLPPGIPGLPGGADGLTIPDFSSLESGEQKLVKVEGKWVPADLAEGWKAGIDEVKQGLGEIGNIPAEEKQMALMMIGSLTKALDGMKKAKNEPEFQLAAFGALGAVMAGAGGLEGLGGPGGPGGAPGGFPGFGGQGEEANPIQKAQARKLAEGEISLLNGDILKGEVSDVDQDGIVVRVDVGGFSKRVNWMQLSQESLKKIKSLGELDKKRYGIRVNNRWLGADHFVKPFIEPEDWQMEQSTYPTGVSSLPELNTPSTAEVNSKLAAYGSPGGIGLLVAVAIGSLVAGLGVAAFKESNVALAGVISFALPIVGPLLLLAKPKVEYEYEDDGDDEYEEEAEAPAGAVMGDTGGGAVAGMLPEAKKMSFAQSGPKKQTSTNEQSWDRDDTRFDRSFFQNNFPNYFKVVLGATERNMALAIRTGKHEYVGQRIKRISGADLHMELLSGKEQKISFSEIGSVDLRPK